MRGHASALGLGGVEHLEQRVEERRGVLARRVRQGRDRARERPARKDVGVFSEEAEQQAREEDVEPVDVLLRLDRVRLDDLGVEPRHALGGLDVGVVEVLELLLLDARPRQEERGVGAELGETDVERVARLRVEREQPSSVAHDDETRPLPHHAVVGRCVVDCGVQVDALAVDVAIEDPVLPERLPRRR